MLGRWILSLKIPNLGVRGGGCQRSKRSPWRQTNREGRGGGFGRRERGRIWNLVEVLKAQGCPWLGWGSNGSGLGWGG